MTDTEVGYVRRRTDGSGSVAVCICGWTTTKPRTSDAAEALWKHRTEHGD